MKTGTKTSKPGWRDDPNRPGIQRYWTGNQWDDTIAPRSKPEPPLRQVRMIVLAILVAAAVIFTVWRIQQPSDFDCQMQALDVTLGNRVAVESACVGRV